MTESPETGAWATALAWAPVLSLAVSVVGWVVVDLRARSATRNAEWRGACSVAQDLAADLEALSRRIFVQDAPEQDGEWMTQPAELISMCTKISARLNSLPKDQRQKDCVDAFLRLKAHVTGPESNLERRDRRALPADHNHFATTTSLVRDLTQKLGDRIDALR